MSQQSGGPYREKLFPAFLDIGNHTGFILKSTRSRCWTSLNRSLGRPPGLVPSFESLTCFGFSCEESSPEFVIRNSSSFVVLSSHPRRDLRHLVWNSPRYDSLGLYVVQHSAPYGKMLGMQALYTHTLVLVVRCLFFHTRSVDDWKL